MESNWHAKMGGSPAQLPLSRPLPIQPTSSGAQEPKPASALNIVKAVVRGIARYRWLVLLSWSVGTAGAMALINARVRPLYEASSLLRVDPRYQDLFDVRSPSGDWLRPYLDTQIYLFTSADVLGMAAADARAAALPRIRRAKDPLVELRRALQIEVVQGTYLIKISAKSPSPADSAAVVNAAVDAFLKAEAEWSDGTTRAQIKNLESYLQELKAQSDEKERAWLELAARVTPGETGSAEASAGASLAGAAPEDRDLLRERLLEVRLELAEAEARLGNVGRGRNDGARDEDSRRVQAQVGQALGSDPELTDIAQQIEEYRIKLEHVRRISRNPNDPAATHVARQIAALKARYGQLRETKGRDLLDQLGAANQGPLADRAVAHADRAIALRERIRGLQAARADLEQMLEKTEEAARGKATDAVRLTLIHEARDGLKQMQDAVIKRLEQLRFETKEEARIRRVVEAKPSREPVFDKRKKYLALAPVGVLCAVVGLVALLELRSGRISHPDQLSAQLRSEVFAVPPLPNPKSRTSGDQGELLDQIARRVDYLRVALCGESESGSSGRCILITSAVGGEGKTTLAIHLTLRCAKAGASTLLIDADLRRGMLGPLLDVPEGPGLVDVLMGTTPVGSALAAIGGPGGFHLLQAGSPIQDPIQVLRGRSLGQLLGSLRRSFDIVIIDSPPVLPVADALTVGRGADGAILAVRCDSSRSHLVERARRQLASAGIPMLAVVVNGVRSSDLNYGNYSYRSQRRPAGPGV